MIEKFSQPNDFELNTHWLQKMCLAFVIQILI